MTESAGSVPRFAPHTHPPKQPPACGAGPALITALAVSRPSSSARLGLASKRRETRIEGARHDAARTAVRHASARVPERCISQSADGTSHAYSETRRAERRPWSFFQERRHPRASTCLRPRARAERAHRHCTATCQPLLAQRAESRSAGQAQRAQLFPNRS